MKQDSDILETEQMPSNVVQLNLLVFNLCHTYAVMWHDSVFLFSDNRELLNIILRSVVSLLNSSPVISISMFLLLMI